MNHDEITIGAMLEKAYNPFLPPETPYPPEFVNKDFLHAAILIPFLKQEDQWHLLFIRRSLHENDRHKGQVAFPGGQCTPVDQNAIGAALRETHEETGILPQDVKILGRLRDMLTITGYRVTPVVGAIPWPYPLKPQPSEVSRIFTIPLPWLANAANRMVKNREIQVLGESVPVVYFQPYDGEVLWGASARITLLLLEALGLSDPEARYRE